MGASGITSTTVLSAAKSIQDESQHWKWVFLAAFMITSAMSTQPTTDATNQRVLSNLAYVLAGLAVGFGTKLGNGCTSGHGICGLARLSKRSFTAVCTFMAVGIMSAYLTSENFNMFPKYTEPLRGDALPVDDEKLGQAVASAFLGLALVATAFFGSKASVTKKADKAKLVPAAISAFLFARGLNRSTMVLQNKVFGFLNVAGITDGTFDLSLMFVMGGGLIVSFLSYQLINEWKVMNTPVSLNCPLATKSGSGKFSVPTNKTIDAQLVIGSAMFGVGWGLGGLCPGPALFAAAQGTVPVVYYWWPAFFVGSYIASKLK